MLSPEIVLYLFEMIKKTAIMLFVAFIGYFSSLFFYPPVQKLKKENPKMTSFMEYRLREARKEGKSLTIRNQWVPLKKISPYLVKAVIIAEDDKFWSHEGFDFEAIQKALEKDLKTGKFKAGGSTISQQLAKNLYLTPTKNLVRKMKEAILTWRIERALSKKRIIELYLNVVEWGDGVFGAEAAARHYFGKPASALGPEEAARLAVVLPNPRKWNPARPTSYVFKRSRVIYHIMLQRGIVVPVYEEVMTDESGETQQGHAPEPEDHSKAVPDKTLGEPLSDPVFKEKDSKN